MYIGNGSVFMQTQLQYHLTIGILTNIVLV